MRIVLLVGIVATLGACAFGQTYNYSNAPVTLQGLSATGSIAVGVQDRRSYILSGNKQEKFVGLMRGGFGNPFDVNTPSGGPLAIDIRDALVASLRTKNATVVPVVIHPSETPERAKETLLATKAHRLVLVRMNEWKSDTYMNMALLYDVSLDVMDDKGNVLAKNALNGRDNLGTQLISQEATATNAFASKMSLLFENDKIIAALR
jgi:hypothetical protein